MKDIEEEWLWIEKEYEYWIGSSNTQSSSATVEEVFISEGYNKDFDVAVKITVVGEKGDEKYLSESFKNANRKSLPHELRLADLFARNPPIDIIGFEVKTEMSRWEKSNNYFVERNDAGNSDRLSGIFTSSSEFVVLLKHQEGTPLGESNSYTIVDRERFISWVLAQNFSMTVSRADPKNPKDGFLVPTSRIDDFDYCKFDKNKNLIKNYRNKRYYSV